MPASMISAPTGGRPKVIGSSIATVAMVPMPGSTPTRVPTSAPIRHINRLIGENATAKPWARLANRSIAPSLHQEAREQRHRQSQHVREQQRAGGGQADADDQRLAPARLVGSERRDQEARQTRDHEPERTDREREGQDCERDEQ